MELVCAKTCANYVINAQNKIMLDWLRKLKCVMLTFEFILHACIHFCININ